jgi:seryl-tRNA synthetase
MEKLMDATKETKERLAAKEAEVHETKTKLDAKLLTIGNIVHESVIVSEDEVRRKSSSRFWLFIHIPFLWKKTKEKLSTMLK